MHQYLHPDMGPAVLRHLAQFANFEGLQDTHGASLGYIAGQAVASAVSELFRSGFAVAYNDVDAFLFSQEFTATRNVLSTITSFDFTPENQYGHVVLASNAVYVVASTARDGMLNEVLCNYCDYAPADEHAMAQAFLRSFDLNCVQVAVRLHDQQLVWTPAFEQFLKTQELLVMNVKTPIHTAVRWFKKKSELEGVFGHDDKTMELLTTSLARIRNRLAKCSPDEAIRWQRALRAQTCFGKGYASKAADVACDLGRYFEVVEVTDRNIPLQTLVSRGGEIPELVTAECSDLILPNYARALQGHWKKHISEQMVAAFRTPWEHAAHRNVALEGPKAIEALSSPKDLDMLDRLVSEHRGLGHQMVRMNTARQLAFVRELKDMARREGLWIFGVFEHLQDAYLELATIDTAQLRAYMGKRFEAAVLEYEEIGRQNALSMLRIAPASMFGYHVKELVSFKDLLDEGARMHHCVGGYFREVSQGSSRILRLQRHRVEDCLTVELYKGYRVKGWLVRQVHGLQNRSASAGERVVADRLALLVNMQTALQSIRLSVPLPLLEKVAVRMPTVADMLAKSVTKGVHGFQKPRLSPYQALKRKVNAWWNGTVLQSFNPPPLMKPAGEATRGFQDCDEDIPF